MPKSKTNTGWQSQPAIWVKRARGWLNQDSLRSFGDLFLILLSVLFGMWLARWTDHASIEWSNTFTAVKDILTAFGIVLGGAWTVYVLQRRRAHSPRAEIEHVCLLWVHREARVLRLGVRLRNCGEVVVDPGASYTEVQIPPESLPGPDAIAERSWRMIATINHPWADNGAIVEPRESDTYWHDVVLADSTRFVQVVSVIECEENGPARLHWDQTTLVDLNQLAKAVTG